MRVQDLIFKHSFHNERCLVQCDAMTVLHMSIGKLTIGKMAIVKITIDYVTIGKITIVK